MEIAASISPIKNISAVIDITQVIKAGISSPEKMNARINMIPSGPISIEITYNPATEELTIPGGVVIIDG